MTINAKGAQRAVTAALVACTVGLGAAPAARAEVLTFVASLDGKSGAEATGSAATGSARIEVDTASRRVSVDISVTGISTDGLWDKLVAAPIGPVHFHKYASADSRDSVLVLPMPYGADYQPTPTGMRLRVAQFDYVPRADLVKPALPFDDFVAALRSGLVILNVHTDAFPPGEISGRLGENRLAGSPATEQVRTSAAVAPRPSGTPASATKAGGSAAGHDHGPGGGV